MSRAAASRLTLAVALALIALAPALVRPDAAGACSLVGFDVDRAVEEYPTGADAIVVAEVVEESLRPGSSEPMVADRWDSRMRILVTLKGETPAEISLHRLGRLGASCEGGPRLQAGDRVLLLLDAHPIGVEFDWGIMAGGQGVIRAEHGEAAFDRSHLADGLTPAGPLDAVLQDIAGRVEAAPADVEAAREALLGAPAPAEIEEADRDEVGHATGLVQVALVLAAGVAAFAVALPIMRWGNHRPE